MRNLLKDLLYFPQSSNERQERKNGLISVPWRNSPKNDVESFLTKAILSGFNNLELVQSMTLSKSLTIPQNVTITGEQIDLFGKQLTNCGNLNCNIICHIFSGVFNNNGTYGTGSSSIIDVEDTEISNNGIMIASTLKLREQILIKGNISAYDVVVENTFSNKICNVDSLTVMRSLTGIRGTLTISGKLEFQPGVTVTYGAGFKLICVEGSTIVNNSDEPVKVLLLIEDEKILVKIKPGSSITVNSDLLQTCKKIMRNTYKKICDLLNNSETESLSLGLIQRFFPIVFEDPSSLFALSKIIADLFPFSLPITVFHEHQNYRTISKCTNFIDKEMTQYFVEPLRKMVEKELGDSFSTNSSDAVAIKDAEAVIIYCFSVNYISYTVINSFGKKYAEEHIGLYDNADADIAIGRYIDSGDTKNDGAFFYSLIVKRLVNDNVEETYDRYYGRLAKTREEKRREMVIAGLKNKVKKASIISITDTDSMDGVEFENLISSLFNNMGFRTSLTPTTGDQGIDVIADNGKRRIGIQAKCYSAAVGNFAVQEASAGAQYYKCSEVMVVTNNLFTPAAKRLAESCKVVLWDREALKMQLDMFPVEAEQSAADN